METETFELVMTISVVIFWILFVGVFIANYYIGIQNEKDDLK